MDHAPGARRSARAGSLRPREPNVDPADVVQRPHRGRAGVPRRPDGPLDRRRRCRDRRRADDPSRRARGRCPRSSACTAGQRGTGARTSPTPSPTRCCWRRRATPACCRTLGGASGAATRSPKASSETAAASTSATSWPASTMSSPRASPIRTGSASAACRTGATWRVGRGPDRPVRRSRRDVGGLELRVVPPDLGGLVVRPRDPGGHLARSGEPVRRTITRDTCPQMHDADADHPGRGRPLHPGEPGRGALHRDRRNGHRGRAGRLPTRGPRPAGTWPRPRRDPSNPGMVRPSSRRRRERLVRLSQRRRSRRPRAS